MRWWESNIRKNSTFAFVLAASISVSVTSAPNASRRRMTFTLGCVVNKTRMSSTFPLRLRATAPPVRLIPSFSSLSVTSDLILMKTVLVPPRPTATTRAEVKMNLQYHQYRFHSYPVHLPLPL
ncbi:hypothetical protein M427DRAFT_324108 [Gonapodya prolifera JEL478]|uniref:Uncharacterized protein n=1 Tax=Gonapodya prolifera (strain JEL478) TaxID=1344416 RepID=A0A139AF08_GONPJ|nr:hypothetical protein M427DRAFT_324108 [Gonapodya prolifera JEL478]|eukprot:KXS15367.1 hypothetical protein M427DRAFT_324108 [Gonapodya prolifera JEL478]